MRYEAGEILTGTWLVFDINPEGQTIITRAGQSLSEAEANIIAFALNAIAVGGRLRGELDAKLWHEYTGPTEGVAPDKEKPPTTPGGEEVEGGSVNG